MLSDLRFACRTLARNRSFTIITVLMLALGIGAAASIFSVTDWILFRATKFPDDVVLVGGRNGEDPFVPIRLEYQVRAYTEQTSVFSELVKTAFTSGNVVVNNEPVASGWLGVTPNFFPLLGVKPVLGRGFLPGEDKPGSDQVVVVSHSFWKRHLGGASDALGRKLIVGDSVCTVVGVLREAQTFPAYFYNDVFRPLTYRFDPVQPWMPQFFLLARLRAGVTREQAEKVLAAAPVDIPPQMKAWMGNDRPILSGMSELNKWMRVEIYWVMLGAVGFLYAISCLNASNLILVRMLGQRREISIRLALGGTRWQIIRLLATESVMLSLLASFVGLLVANWFFPLLLSAAGSPGAGSDWTTWTLGWRVVGVMGLLSVLTSLAITLVPALRIMRTDINAGLKDGGASLGESPTLARLRGAFVVLQAAFAVILLVGAGLMIRTFQNLQKVDLGFDPTGRAKILLGFPPGYPTEWEPRLIRLREIQAELMRIPGVRAVGFGQDVLLSGFYYASHTIEGPAGKPLKASMLCFSQGFQDASGLTLKRGHWLTQSRGNEVLVNESFARTCWPGQEPVGQFIRPVGPNPGAEPGWKGWLVAGVVGDVRSTMREAPGNIIYGPEGWGTPGFNSFVVQLSRDYDESLGGLIRKNLYAFDSRIVVFQILRLTQAKENQVWAERLADAVLKVLAGIALVLAIVGVYCVLSYTVDQRRGEFGVRLALGATRGKLMSLVLRRGVALVFLGVVIGVGGALALTRFLQSLLFETSAHNPWVLLTVGLLLLGASVLACIIPAHRASKVDITRLMRSE